MNRIAAVLSARRARVESRKPKTFKEAVSFAVGRAVCLWVTAGITLLAAPHLIPGSLVMVR